MRIRHQAAMWLIVLAGMALAHAQSFPAPLLTSAQPAGGQAGATVEITLAGVDLDEVTALTFSNAAIKAERLPDPPPNPKDKNPPAPPPRFKVTIPASVPAGHYDLRAIGKWGISNPRTFVVGTLPEIRETEPNNDVPQAQELTINQVLHGTIESKTDVDYSKFQGKKGQRLVIACQAGSIDSRLSPLLQVFDSADRELAASSYYRGRNAVVDLALPADGEYLIRLCSHTYQFGGADYFYRLTLTDGRWLDAAYPPVIAAGKPATVTLLGRNLPGGQREPLASREGPAFDRLTVQVNPPSDPASLEQIRFGGVVRGPSASLDGFEYRLKGPAGFSNPVLLTYADAPVVLDNEKNQDTPQQIPVPCELCGRIERPRDEDWYVFRAKQNEVLYLDAYADRLGSPIDLHLLIRRADTGQVVVEFDDSQDIPTAVGKFYTRSGDPKGRFVAPADGEYELLVRSHTGGTRGSPRFIYHVSIRPEQPDFRLVLVGNVDVGGGGCVLRQGGSRDLQVICFRQDGFDGPVTLTVEGLPNGVTCPPQVLGPKLRETALVLTASANAKDWAGEIKVVGKATIDGKEVVRLARAGTLVWPTGQNQNIPAVSRLARSIALAVRDKGPYSLGINAKDQSVPVGSQVTVKVNVNRHWNDFKTPVQVSRLAAPVQSNGQLINIGNVNINPGNSADIRFQVPNNAPAGAYNLVFKGSAQFPYQKDPKAKKANVRFEAVTPPVTLTIYDQVAELSTAKPKITLVPGTESPLVVKFKRLHDYKGEFTVQIVTPSGLSVSAATVKIPPGGNEAKLMLKVPANAKLGEFPKLLVRATAVVNRINLTHELPLTAVVSPDSGDVKIMKLLPEGSPDWQYLPAAQAKGDAWLQPGFDAASWKTAETPAGIGEEEIARRKGTTLSEAGASYLFRHEFDVPAALLAEKGVIFRLSVASDDSAMVHVNGQPADRDPAEDHEFMYWNRQVEIPAKLLRPGKNLVAVEVRNRQGSSDLYFDLELQAVVPVEKKP